MPVESVEGRTGLRRSIVSGTGCPRVEFESEGITLNGGGYAYFIDRERISTSAKAVAWVYHIAEKTWATPRDLQMLVLYADLYGEADVHAPH